MIIDRRSVLKGSSALLALPAVPAGAFPPAKALPNFYEEIEQRTFRWFWRTANRTNGLVPDRWPTPSFSSIAAVGFALPAYAIGAERGWCSRAEARDLTLATLRHLWNSPQGPETTGTSGYKGFFYHFLDMNSGARFRNTELSSVDTTILLMGVLFAGQYFEGDNAAEREIRTLSNSLYDRADWNFVRSDGRGAISMGWHPVDGLIERNWVGFNEGMFVNILALGSRTHPAPASLWNQWTGSYSDFWRGDGQTRRLAFAPLFGHQYSQIFIDFRGIRDAPMRAAGFDYFENSRRETYANRAYCIANPMGWRGYSDRVWGLTACDGPGDFQLPFQGTTRQYFGYSARGPVNEPDGRDDGTLAPTAALGSLPFAPEIVLPCAEA
ncbi:MAG TPA: glucoamylase family protein, partial [Sphingomicrobium sp.]|nr:glucoamylase family protein [Sphingomicrobium sp.]